MLSKKDYAKAADDILRQVVCHCGCYRHHGVDWMPEGSGEGLSVAISILQRVTESDRLDRNYSSQLLND